MAKTASKAVGRKAPGRAETDFCAIHGTLVSLDESKPCVHCVRDFPTRLSEKKPKVQEEGTTLFRDLLAFVSDYYREYEPVSDVNDLTETMVNRAKALIKRAQ